jgi:uncharacterized protein (TIGR02246 family)
LLVLPFFFAPPAQARAEDDAVKVLQPVLAEYTAAYNAGSLDRVMDHWSEDADFVDIRGNLHQGKELISALFRRGFADNAGRKITMKSDACKFLTPEVILDDGILELTSPDGAPARGRYTVVWTKREDAWRIRAARDIPLEAEASEDQPPPLEQLAWLVGRWAAKSEKYQISLECNWDLDKRFLVQRFHIRSSEDDFQVATWIAFDPSQGRFRSWYFDSRGGYGGGPWSLRGNVWRTDIVAVLPDGRLGSSWMTWEQVDENTAIWRAIEREVGGEPLPDAEQRYVRVPDEPAATQKTTP